MLPTHEVETKMKVVMATNYLYLYVLQWHRYCTKTEKEMNANMKMLQHKNQKDNGAYFVDM